MDNKDLVFAIQESLERNSARQRYSAEQIARALRVRWAVLHNNGTIINELSRLTNEVNPSTPESDSLFMRILRGQPILRWPPPKSFRRPGHPLIEDPGPTHVVISFSIGRPKQIHINNDAWRILRENHAAAKVRELLTRTFDSEAFDQAMAEGPSWDVQFGYWSACTIKPGMGHWNIPRRAFNMAHFLRPVDLTMARMGPWGNAMVVETKPEEDMRVMAQCWVLEKSAHWRNQQIHLDLHELMAKHSA